MKCNVQDRGTSVGYQKDRLTSASQLSTVSSQPGFTLIELLVVISIIAILAAFLVPVTRSVERQMKLSRARAEMITLETAIERYKAERGYFPPDNPGNPLTNQLYYELTGTTLTTGSPPTYQTADGMQTLTAGQLTSLFGPSVVGFQNVNKGGGEDAKPSKNFLSANVSPMMGTFTANGVSVTNLITGVNGDPTYKPMGVAELNPWRYVSSNPTNNRGTYDLWVQIKIGNKTNLICNWSKQAEINTPWP